MEKKSEILENFKTAIGSTVKSLSNSENVEVSFGNQNFQSKNNSIKLPEIERINDKINYSQIRALADSKSLRLRFSDNKTFKSYEPAGNISKKLYKINEIRKVKLPLGAQNCERIRKPKFHVFWLFAPLFGRFRLSRLSQTTGFEEIYRFI